MFEIPLLDEPDVFDEEAVEAEQEQMGRESWIARQVEEFFSRICVSLDAD
jgi:hypothetical protein